MHRSRAILSILLAVLIAICAITPAFALTQSDVTKHQTAAQRARAQAAAAEAAARKLAGQIADLDKEIERLQNAADALQPQIDAATARANDLASQVASLEAEVARTQAEIAATEAEYERQQRLLSERVSETYRQGDWFYLDVLLGSEDVSDFIVRTEFVSRAISSNNAVARDLASTERRLTDAKNQLSASLSQVAVKKGEADRLENSLRGLKARRETAAAQRTAAQRQKTTLMTNNRKNAKRLRALAEAEEAESRRIAAELARHKGSGQYSGSMAWPVPASHRITSPYGYRICPFHGRELHPGIDIGAPSGSSIVAAGSGTVIYAGYRGGYGNTIMIDHGNGVVTLYAHQLAGGIKVHSGQHVGKGDRIGTVGSTGNSTGPHLHFEVRVNGTPKNPMNYL